MIWQPSLLHFSSFSLQQIDSKINHHGTFAFFQYPCRSFGDDGLDRANRERVVEGG